MPAGPAPMTATRSGRSGEGTGPAPSLVTGGILTRRGWCAPGPSDAGDVAVEAAADVLGEGHPAPAAQRGPAAVRQRAGERARAGEPAVEPVEVAVGRDRAGDLPPLRRDGIQPDRGAAGDQ